MAENTLYYGDNLEILRRHVKDESVDLIYLDPPFNSNVDYNVLFKERDGTEAASQVKAFKDTWTWDLEAARAYEAIVTSSFPSRVVRLMVGLRESLGPSDMLAYVASMGVRLLEMWRVLKPGGALYLHCDPTASHYLKLVLDAVFAPYNFRSEIIWKRTSAHSSARRFGPVHDTLLFYVKGEPFTWNAQFAGYDEGYVERFYKHEDDGGRYRLSDLTAAGTRRGQSGQPWRGFNPTSVGRHWAVPGEAFETVASTTGLADASGLSTQAKLDLLDKHGRIAWPKKGSVPQFKRYLRDMAGVSLQDVWTDIKPVGAQAAERLGYPTQKPQSLLERIINASSNPGDVVLDPFCGCGTTVAAAQQLGRRWIGIDITSLAISLIKVRLQDQFDGGAKFEAVGEPVSLDDARKLARENPWQFQWWALGRVGARPFEQKKGSDKGIDGRLYFHDEGLSGRTKQIIFSVKAGQVGVDQVRDLRGVIEREQAAIGVFISLQAPTKAMYAEAASAGFYDSPWGKKYPHLQLLTIEEMFQGRQVEMPPAHATNVTFKKAPKAKRKKAANKQLDFKSSG